MYDLIRSDEINIFRNNVQKMNTYSVKYAVLFKKN